MNLEEKLDSKTLTTRITAGAKIWMLGCGFKPVIEEVPVSNGWVADLAGIIQPTRTELKRNLRLLDIIDANYNDDKEFIFFNKYAIPMTAIVEVKVTKADFKKDIPRKYDMYDYNPPAHLGYLAFPKGMIDEKDIPYYWGHLIFGKNGNKLLKHRPPLRINPQNPGDTIDIIAAIAERTHNKWHFREFKEMLKNYNKKQSQSNYRLKASSAINVIRNMLKEENKKTLSELFEYDCISLTQNQKEECEKIDKVLFDKRNC
jgi:hypothetical protein